MHISSITLDGWKAYPKAEFNFDAPIQGRNIVLIGANNGYGKTSLFEAIVLGIFGRYGLGLIARRSIGGGSERTNRSYKKFLEGALHSGTTTVGRNKSCSVRIVFVDGDDEQIEIERIWYFSDRGEYRDEDVRVIEGLMRKPIRHEGDDREAWFRSYIAENLLPDTIAHFFMFDAEEIRALAEDAMSNQVRQGIEDLLGVSVLKKLADDLQEYEKTKSRESPNVTNDAIEERAEEHRKLRSRYSEKEEYHKKVEASLAEHSGSYQRLAREMPPHGIESETQLQDRIRKIFAYNEEIKEIGKRRDNLLATDIALALPGPDLRKRLRKRLEGEIALEHWDSVRKAGKNNVERFVSAVESDVVEIEPVLDEGQRDAVLEIVRNAIDELWNPPPEDCAERYLHYYFGGNERKEVIHRLSELDGLGSLDIAQLQNSIAAKKSELKQLERDKRRADRTSPSMKAKGERFLELHNDIMKLTKEAEQLGFEKRDLKGQLDQKFAELQRMRKQQQDAVPSQRLAMRASEVISVIDEIVRRAVPSQIKAIETAMTNEYRSMAHKRVVSQIKIDEECNVKLYNSEGAELRRHSFSAGEKQIFTQALISSVSSVSGRGFPMVIDTSLARLDRSHRKGVLSHLAQRNHQVILLSTDSEVVDEELRVIESHVQKKYLVEFHEEKNGDVRSTVRVGYFEGQEANT